jgi:hypothetical protein
VSVGNRVIMVFIDQDVIPAAVWWNNGRIYIGEVDYGLIYWGSTTSLEISLEFDVSDVLPPSVTHYDAEIAPCTTTITTYGLDLESGTAAPAFSWPIDMVKVSVCVRHARVEKPDPARFLRVWEGMFRPGFSSRSLVFESSGRFTDDATVALTLSTVFGWFPLTLTGATALTDGLLYSYLLRGDVLASRCLLLAPPPRQGWSHLVAITDCTVRSYGTWDRLSSLAESCAQRPQGTLFAALSPRERSVVAKSTLCAVTICDDACRRVGIGGMDPWLFTAYPLAPTLSRLVGVSQLTKCVRVATNGTSGWTRIQHRLVFVSEGIVMRSYRLGTSLSGVATVTGRAHVEEGHTYNRSGVVRIEGDMAVVNLCNSQHVRTNSCGLLASTNTIWDMRLPYWGSGSNRCNRALRGYLVERGVDEMVSSIAASSYPSSDTEHAHFEGMVLLLYSAAVPDHAPTAEESLGITTMLHVLYKWGVNEHTIRMQVAQDKDLGMGIKAYLAAHKHVSLVVGAQYFGIPVDVRMNRYGTATITLRAKSLCIKYIRSSKDDGKDAVVSVAVYHKNNLSSDIMRLRQVCTSSETYIPSVFTS